MYYKSRKQMAAFLMAAALCAAPVVQTFPVFALDDTPAVALEVNAGKTVKGTFISYMDDTEKADVDKVVGAYAKLPDSIKQKLVNDQVRIILYDKLEGPATKLTYAASSYSAPEYYTYDQGSDAKVTNENYIQQEIKDHASGKVRINNAVIRISSGKYEEQALLHSVGHWIDDMNSSDGKRLSASQANGFESLYEKYKTTLRSVDKYAAVVISNPSEMFAEGVRLYIESPGTLQKISPELYAYITTAINNAVNNGY